MVKLIMGLSGSGKTKTLVSMVHEAVNTSHGDVVCIEKSQNLTFDIPHQVRLIGAREYGIKSNALLEGFLYGLHAGNYDITHVFIDNFYKILDDSSEDAVADLLDKLDAFGQRENVDFIITASADPAAAGERLRKYL